MVATVERARTRLTVDDLLTLNKEGRDGELWEGDFVEVTPTGGPQGRIIRRLSPIDRLVDELGIGEAWGGESGFTLHLTSGQDTVLAPDLAVVPVSYARTVNRHHRGFHDVTPLLAIEVKSPSDEEKDIARKLAMYLDAGVPEVWWLRPDDATVTRHWPDRGPTVLGLGETVEGVGLLPGFSMKVDDMFPPEEAEEPSETM